MIPVRSPAHFLRGGVDQHILGGINSPARVGVGARISCAAALSSLFGGCPKMRAAPAFFHAQCIRARLLSRCDFSFLSEDALIEVDLISASARCIRKMLAQDFGAFWETRRSPGLDRRIPAFRMRKRYAGYRIGIGKDARLAAG